MLSLKKAILTPIAALVAVFVLFIALVFSHDLPLFQLHSSAKKVMDRKGVSIIHNSLGYSHEKAIEYFGEPYEAELIREQETLLYWDYDPVTLQIHFHKDSASRLAYMTRNANTLRNLRSELKKLFGDERSWERATVTLSGAAKTALVNKKRRVSLVEEPNAVIIYGYLLK